MRDMAGVAFQTKLGVGCMEVSDLHHAACKSPSVSAVLALVPCNDYEQVGITIYSLPLLNSVRSNIKSRAVNQRARGRQTMVPTRETGQA